MGSDAKPLEPLEQVSPSQLVRGFCVALAIQSEPRRMRGEKEKGCRSHGLSGEECRHIYPKSEGIAA